jgi:16S rRNA (adenine1518-N6/adenine1519-N6)-dimethyltransferase
MPRRTGDAAARPEPTDARRRDARLRYNRGVSRTRRPKLGQHFLTSETYRRRIVELLPLRPDDLVLEIGPGRGAMTELLARRARRVVAVELDAALASQLAEKLQAQERIEIVPGDILATNLAALCRRYEVEKCFVFGNLPYAITSPILHHVLGQADSIRAMALLVQREVAERLTAAPGSRDYGYLSVFAQLHADPRIVLNVPPGAFSPPPKVQSALVDFTLRPRFPAWPAQERAPFLAFVKACFGQKRKTLLNNLAPQYGRARVLAALANLRVRPSTRAEELHIRQFAELCRSLVNTP